MLLNFIRIFGIILIILAYLSYLIIINLRKATESQTATLMRILTNYLQVISTILAFNANYPQSFTEIFSPIQTVGHSSESIVSLDCFIQDSEMNVFAPNATIFKIFLISLLPLILIILYIIIWLIMWIPLKKYFEDLKRNIVVSIIVILFLLHPTITRAGLNIFQCVKTGENEYRVKIDMNME